MANILNNRNEKIANIRKQSSFENFLYEVASRYPLMYYKNNKYISVYPDVDRIWGITDAKQFDANRSELSQLDHSPEKSIFEHLWELFWSITFPNIHHFVSTENWDYANYTSNVKNPYLSFHITGWCENVLYSLSTKIRSKNIYNSVMSWVDCENVYMSSCVIRWYNVFFSKLIENSSNIRFWSNLVGCQECILCHDLTNKSYCIDNIQYEKDEYMIKKDAILSDKKKFEQRHKNTLSQNSDTMIGGTDTENALYSYNVHTWKNIVFCGHDEGLSDVVDSFVASWWSNYAAVCSIWGDSEHIYCSAGIRRSYNLYYSFFMETCSYCFGCIGLKNKNFCIFNKQYEKEEWFEVVDKILKQMEEEWVLWSFLPGSINPFYINDTAAWLLLDLDKESCTQDWRLRRDWEHEVDIPETLEVIWVSELSNFETQNGDDFSIDKSILQKVIKLSDNRVYRVLPLEFEFLQRYSLPLPRKYRLDRIKTHFGS